MVVSTRMITNEPGRRDVTRGQGALAGVAAGAAALGVAELLAAILPGAMSPIIAVGDLVIALQPAGAKQLMVDLFGEADKLLLNLVIAAVALTAAAIIGMVARNRPAAAQVGFGAFGLLAVGAGLREPLAEPIITLIISVAAVVVAIGTFQLLIGLARGPRVPSAEMPDWERRRFLGTSLAVVGVAAGAGLLGRFLVQNAVGAAQAVEIPPPLAPAASPPPPLDVAGITSLVTPNTEFYRIDTALLVPRADMETWRLRMTGLVDRPLELTYDELLAMPLFEQYVTIACVSNEVGGHLVGNALWRGVHLKELFERAGVQPEASQVVGRSIDGFTVGFPLAHALADDREAMVAVAMNGEALPASHGFPARLIVPGLFGYVSATKWLSEIELTTWEGFDAYWVPLGWSKEGPILTQSRIDTPRSGDRPAAGIVPIAGVAWAPDRGVRAVEIQVDDGPWVEAEVSSPISDATWVQFVHRWDATPGDHRLQVRAIDGTGDVQTDQRTPPAPDGARGHHTVSVTVG
ncbi:MAG TPA: molybdopterin-dependent oxidoreductase [Candidatus Limnocylindria bacterium]